MFNKFKTRLIGLLIVAVFWPMSIRGYDADNLAGEDAPSIALRSLYRVLTDFESGHDQFDKVLKAYPSEVKSELMRIICMESEYQDAKYVNSITLDRASNYSARYFGHEDKFYIQLKVLIQTLKTEYSDPSNLAAEENRVVNGIISNIINGLGIYNISDKSLDKLIDLIDSGLLGPGLQRAPDDQYNFKGSRADAYNALIVRYENVADPAQRDRIIGVLRHYHQTEADSRLKKNMEMYLKSKGLLQAILEIRREGKNRSGLKESEIQSRNGDYVEMIGMKPSENTDLMTIRLLSAIFIGLAASVSALLIWNRFSRKS